MSKFNKKDLIDICEETISYLNQNKYDYRDRVKKIQFPKAVPLPDPKYDTLLEIVDMDTLDAVKYYTSKTGEKYCFLDMASSNPEAFGGGYLTGSRAQEETICRRSSLLLAFSQTSPPVPEYGGILCENISIIRENESKGFSFISKENQITANCIMACALRKPEINPATNRLSEIDTQKTVKKIDNLLEILVQENQHNVVLGALGCGAYGNPTRQIANIFKMLLDGKYRGQFKHVIFAIIDNKWSDNYEIFKDVFNSKNK